MGSRVLCPRQRPHRASSGLTCRRSRGPGVPMRGLGRGGMPDQVHSRIRRHLEMSSGQHRSRVFQAGKRQFCAASIRARWESQTRPGQLLSTSFEPLPARNRRGLIFVTTLPEPETDYGQPNSLRSFANAWIPRPASTRPPSHMLRNTVPCCTARHRTLFSRFSAARCRPATPCDA